MVKIKLNKEVLNYLDQGGYKDFLEIDAYIDTVIDEIIKTKGKDKYLFNVYLFYDEIKMRKLKLKKLNEANRR